MDDAIWDVLKYHISVLASNKVDPLIGLNELINEVHWNYDFYSKTKQYFGDSHGIDKLIGLYWGHDDLVSNPTVVSYAEKYGDEAIEQIKRDIVTEAKEWINCHCREEAS